MSAKATQTVALRSFVHSSNVLMHARNAEKVPLAQGSPIIDQFASVRKDTLEVLTLNVEPNATEIVTALQVGQLVSTEFVRIHVTGHAV